ncbi:MAG: hypothetical protein EAZ70_01040 [Runella slithyformis]|nr:MAG: hypothetical protein EAY79_08610 [Runella slithyformis]TAF96899.1 MAG: hypothetical protein EAZ46_03750 [Runella sp.]TAG21342.1 MAG: hypothetical protein EAZ38_08325 [Cytophagales bacterium]TAG40700.1 MAG: hypothetical protein EAZ32_05725 [Cytophagia bacterium]TAF01642.1 MAG: hypothetical protein EAZ80_02445 [Runella slithyformis]
MKNLTPYLLLGVVLVACNKQRVQDQKAQEIIKKCVEMHGGTHYQNFDVSFDFRKYSVGIQHNGTQFRYECSTQDSLKNTIKDVLTNTTFERTINGKKQELSAKDTDKYRESVNSVAYFALLPFKLTEPAVNLQYVGSTAIEGQNYDKIKVWFEAEGGGKDHEDIFCYWINQQTHTLDYLAYANGGPRFRKATKRTTVAGVVFQDYENYEILDKSAATSDYDQAFVKGKAKLLSIIEQSNYANRGKQ